MSELALIIPAVSLICLEPPTTTLTLRLDLQLLTASDNPQQGNATNPTALTCWVSREQSACECVVSVPGVEDERRMWYHPTHVAQGRASSRNKLHNVQVVRLHCGPPIRLSLAAHCISAGLPAGHGRPVFTC